MPRFDGNLTIPFHFLRQALKYSLILWHQTEDVSAVTSFLRQETTAYLGVYSAPRSLGGLRDDFEMTLAIGLALSGMHEKARQLVAEFDFRPRENGYAYYAGFKQALLALMLGDESLATQARDSLEGHNATKFFYFPSKSIIVGALDGDLDKLKSSIRPISHKFDGYAAKCRAVEDGIIDARSLDSHWFSPYPDWAFYAQAIRRFGAIEARGTFWMPMQFLNSYSTSR